MQQKPIERRAFEFLQRTATALIVVPAIADWIGIRRGQNFKGIPTAFRVQMNLNNDTQEITDLVGQFRQQGGSILNPNQFALIIAPDDQGSPGRHSQSRRSSAPDHPACWISILYVGFPSFPDIS